MKTPKPKFLFCLSGLTLYCLSFFHQFPLASAAYTPTDYILLKAGSPGNSTANDGRVWIGDEGSKIAPFPQAAAARAEDPDSAEIDVPYSTARISRSNFTYTFPVTDGPKFIRLYFNPASYSGFKDFKALFSVKSGIYTLLANFSGYRTDTSSEMGTYAASREFCINVAGEAHQQLTVTFAPSPTSSHDFYAFVNGIEIVSMPPSLYYSDQYYSVANVYQINTFYTIEDSTVLETVFRLNVGGPSIYASDDSGLFRIWSDDNLYFRGNSSSLNEIKQPYATIKYNKQTPAYVAPEQVYLTSRSLGLDRLLNERTNLTWIIPVESGFIYLIRLHFCETNPLIVSGSVRQFNIYIDSQMVEEAADVIQWSGGNGVPVYRDYALWIGPERGEDKYNLAIELGARVRYSLFVDVFLNGIELFKLNNTGGTLVGKQREPPKLPAKKKSANKKVVLTAIASGVIVGLVLLALLLCTIFRPRRRRTKHYSSYSKTSWWGRIKASSLPEELCLQFDLAEIKEATNNFHKSCIIGRGGFGYVYKGKFGDMENEVAIKRLNPMSKQGSHEFKTEIKMLSSLRHRHLVSLIGYCKEGREMILVYEFMSNGTLSEYLYETNNEPLSWRQRLKICIDAARGLEYLHTGAPQKVIHRDVKTTNILLDDKWVAKVSDFGLSKIGPTSMPVETMVKGTMGYLDPEYYNRQQVTEKCDVYSFGVVLLEVLCGRRPLNPKLGKEQSNLANWAKMCMQKGTFDQIIDPYLIGKISPACLKKYAEIAMSCLQEQGTPRPTMADVADSLEVALRLQENAETEEGLIVDPVTLYRDVSFSSAIAAISSILEYGVEGGSSTSDLTGIGTAFSDSGTSKATNSTGV